MGAKRKRQPAGRRELASLSKGELLDAAEAAWSGASDAISKTAEVDGSSWVYVNTEERYVTFATEEFGVSLQDVLDEESLYQQALAHWRRRSALLAELALRGATSRGWLGSVSEAEVKRKVRQRTDELFGRDCEGLEAMLRCLSQLVKDMREEQAA